jgi:hypothetical protein
MACQVLCALLTTGVYNISVTNSKDASCIDDDDDDNYNGYSEAIQQICTFGRPAVPHLDFILPNLFPRHFCEDAPHYIPTQHHLAASFNPSHFLTSPIPLPLKSFIRPPKPLNVSTASKATRPLRHHPLSVLLLAVG